MSDESQALCQICGFCCDGTLFGDARLTDADSAAAIAAAGVALSGDGEKFLQPCPAYRDGKCGLYGARFQVCRVYRCRLLSDFETGELPFEAARERIATTRAAVADVRHEMRMVPGGESLCLKALYAVMRTLEAPNRTTALLKYASLRPVLDKHFK